MVRFADEWSEWAQNHPHHETHVEVEKRGEQRRRMAGFLKVT